ncbi:MAG: adenylosuccinate synthase [Bacteroidales bacterium]|nr:adenylosuccinate synthase [Bacteroidales bacterium]MCB8998475.1 adenylosuccinate synthase [Bacteroidales bacterium]MCB9012916.1 adenylosuccinate synthase [Bacteroidales bacterium]
MKIDVILGLQWGDEGKGKIVDVLSPAYDVIARFQGGPNAGHTLEFNNIKHVLHNIPSGIFRKNTLNIIGNGVVLDPVIFKKEVDKLAQMGVDITHNLVISRKAHLILPSHRILDAASEQAKGKGKIGSTLKGIGPTYMDKTGRNGLRVGDIESDFRAKYDTLVEKHRNLLKIYDYEYNIEELEADFFEGIETLKKFKFIDSEHLIHQYLSDGKRILAEGAQGTMLDIDFGSYPFVTSSNTICAGVCTGLGAAPSNIGEVMGIFKAYCTRVGSGPFPTELFDATGEELRSIGHEFGATTGRPRRCGWIDLVALKYSIMLNGVTQLIMTKADVLDTFDTIRLATAYISKGKTIKDFPYEIDENTKAVYTDMPGWKTDLTAVRTKEEFPDALKKYIAFLEKELEVPVSYVSVGPDREQIIKVK